MRPGPAVRNFIYTSLICLVSVFFSGLSIEILLRRYPLLVPYSYRLSMPVCGIELFNPGILSRTPIEAVPLPYLSSSLYGQTGGSSLPAPDDLVGLGLVDPGDNPNSRFIPSTGIVFDELGFPNERVPEHSDIVLVGDSFAVIGGVSYAHALVNSIRTLTSMSCYDLAISGIGAVRESYLFRKVGRSMKPRFVVWMYFGGNDVSDDELVRSLRASGVRTYADQYKNSPVPDSLVFGLAKFLLSGLVGKKTGAVDRKSNFLAALRYKNIPLWFDPRYLRRLALSKEEWSLKPAFEVSWNAVFNAYKQARADGARFLFVYVPSKGQVYLPLLKEHHAELLRMAAFDFSSLLKEDSEAFTARMLKNRNSLEELLLERCARAGIPALSVREAIEEQARAGRAVFLPADSHWNFEGQRCAAVLISDWLKRVVADE